MFPAWIGKSSTEVEELKIPAGGASLALLLPAPDPSVAAVLTSGEISAAVANPEKFLSWLRGEIPATGQGTFRILGTQEAIQALAPLLRQLPLQEGKHVPLEGGAGSLFLFLPREGRLRAERKAGQSLAPARAASGKTRVLVVDDSETIRKLLQRIISEDPELECVGTVELPSQAMAAIEQHKPDVITLDIHMPEMDGVTLLKKILPRFAIPTVMISALSREDGTFVLDALDSGAVDYIQKPSFAEIRDLAPVICEKLKSAAQAKIRQAPSLTFSFTRERSLSLQGEIDLSYLIAIGSSTGGTEALKEVLTRMPEKIPPIVIVQHIPPVFSRAFADRMNQLCPFEVKEAEDGDLVAPGRVLVAPGGRQMKVRQTGDSLKIVIDDSAPVNRHKPSVDYLFDSIAALKRKKVAAAILTGMGADGAKGLVKLRETGAKTFAQDEASCVVFGMPKEALRLGGTSEAVPLDRMADRLLSACSAANRRKTA